MAILKFVTIFFLITGSVSIPEPLALNAHNERHQPPPVVETLQHERVSHHENPSLTANDILPPERKKNEELENVKHDPSSDNLKDDTPPPYEVAMQKPLEVAVELNNDSDWHNNITASVLQQTPTWLVCQIMERIVAIFIERLPPNSGSQFAVLAIIPESVSQPEQIDPFLSLQFENINYRFTRPTAFPNQRCRTHAEIVAMEGGPNDQNVLQGLWNAFVNGNPGNRPRFTVLYTWIYPCRECTSRIINHFGAGQGDTPAYNIPTFIGRTTAGTGIHPPLNDQDRTDIANQLRLHNLSLYIIRRRSSSLLHMNKQSHLEVKRNTAVETELCNSCYLNNIGLGNIYNCDDTGPSNPDNPTCPNVIMQDNIKVESTYTKDSCCEEEQVNQYTAARGQTCRTDSPCGYHGRSYAWCYLQDGSWDYCCTGECGNHENKGYDWCVSGSTWQYCKRDPYPSDMTAKRDACLSDHQCGYYGQDYTWCYKEGGGWDYCCTSSCGEHGEEYDWCTAGQKWQYCKHDLPYNNKDAKAQNCKSTSPCGYHGKDYAWCYLEEGGWDYCCTGNCGPHGETYDWCTSGSQWSKCRITDLKSVTLTYNLKECKSSHQCGYYGANYAWCYTTDGSWDYCCTKECGLNGEKYDWCTTGMDSNWKYCKRDGFPESSITVTGTPCKSGNYCGYHGYDYSWCVTENGWDYCCSSTCGKYDTSSNFCATGNTHRDCCCSEYQ